MTITSHENNARPRWSRRRWVAEHFGCDMTEVEPYQDTRTPSGGVPVFQHGGRRVAVALGRNEFPKVCLSLPGAVAEDYEHRTHWRHPSVTVYIEKM